MILLDTNVISEFMIAKPDERVVQWLNRQPRSSVWTTSVNVFEIRYGLQTMPSGRRQTILEANFEEILRIIFSGQILAFDAASAGEAARLQANGKKQGRLQDGRDTMIAGIVVANHAKLATRNVKHFEEIAGAVVNPWEG